MVVRGSCSQWWQSLAFLRISHLVETAPCRSPSITQQRPARSLALTCRGSAASSGHSRSIAATGSAGDRLSAHAAKLLSAAA